LLNHPKCLAVAIKEQMKIIRRHGDYIDYDILLEMDYLHNCIKEALRMRPITPCLFRKVHKDFTVQTKEGNMYEIPKGHTLVSPIQFNSQIPCIYKNPHAYDPERFGPGREEDKVGGRFSYLAFSCGRHACLGEGYAYMQIKVIWSYLLRNFELELVSPFPEKNWTKLVMEPRGKVLVSYKRQRLDA
jgi:sterol 14alpha-demethylase